MIDGVLNLYKYEGETPLQALNRLRKDRPEYKDAVLSYAGRLDPLAEGVLVVLVGEENKKREEYLKLDKEYVVDALFCIETDTGDVLGKVVEIADVPERLYDEAKRMAEQFIGYTNQAYPPYSSKPVLGKPLYAWAKEGRLGDIEIPSHRIRIDAVHIKPLGSISSADLLRSVEEKVAIIKGDFRQHEIIDSWRKAISGGAKHFPIMRMRVVAGSGAYMRVLVGDIARACGTKALAYHILRKRVGEYEMEEAIGRPL